MEGKEHTANSRIELDIAVLSNEITHIRKDLEYIKDLFKASAQTYVTRQELKDKLDPIRNLVYGAAGFALLSLLGTIRDILWNAIK